MLPPPAMPSVLDFPTECLLSTLASRGWDDVKKFRAIGSLQQLPATELNLTEMNEDVKQMYKAIDRGDSVGVEALLRSGKVSATACNRFGLSIMQYACKHLELECVRTLIRYGARTDVRDDCGRTLLHAVCWPSRHCHKRQSSASRGGGDSSDGDSEDERERRGAGPSYGCCPTHALNQLELFRMLCLSNPALLVAEDRLGACPLEYVERPARPPVFAVIGALADVLWPIRDPEDPAAVSTGSMVPPPLADNASAPSAVAGGNMVGSGSHAGMGSAKNVLADAAVRSQAAAAHARAAAAASSSSTSGANTRMPGQTGKKRKSPVEDDHYGQGQTQQSKRKVRRARTRKNPRYEGHAIGSTAGKAEELRDGVPVGSEYDLIGM